MQGSTKVNLVPKTEAQANSSPTLSNGGKNAGNQVLYSIYRCFLASVFGKNNLEEVLECHLLEYMSDWMKSFDRNWNALQVRI